MVEDPGRGFELGNTMNKSFQLLTVGEGLELEPSSFVCGTG